MREMGREESRRIWLYSMIGGGLLIYDGKQVLMHEVGPDCGFSGQSHVS